MKLLCILKLFSLLVLNELQLADAKIRVADTLRSIGRKALTMNLDTINLGQAGPDWANYAAGGGVLAYRSSIISSLSQMDRGENEAAMETLRVAISSLVLGTTQTFGLPVMSVVVDKIVKKYASSFPQTISGLKTYNQMLGDEILQQATTVVAPHLGYNTNDIKDTLDTLKNRIKTDFGEEAKSFLKSSLAYDDLIKPLQNAKTWAKVAKWADFLAGPLFDAANIAFTGWQLHGAIQSGDQLAVASGSIGIVGSIVGIGTFVAGSLATAGSVIAATAGPIGAVIGCILTLASLIIDVINEYNPDKKINEHLQLVRSLTTASKDMMKGQHYQTLQRVTSNDINAGFNTLFDVNQAMLVKAPIQDEWDTLKGLKGQAVLHFKPKLVKPEEDYLAVGDMRVFDQNNYKNWIFQPTGTEEIGYNFYGKKLIDDVDQKGIFVRVNTDMVTNKDTNMWFWLNGVEITTYGEGKEDVPADDNVNIGDFRTFFTSSERYLTVNTGAGNDLLQITGIICSSEQQQQKKGQCLFANMGDGDDTISFEGMDVRDEKLKWLLDNKDLSKTKTVVGVVFDFIEGVLSYQLKDTKEAVKFGTMRGVEGYIGSPLNDIVRFDDRHNHVIKESKGRNTYELHLKTYVGDRQYTIEDNSDTPGELIIFKTDLTWRSVIYQKSTNVIIVLLHGSDTAQIFIKRCKPGLDKFKVTLNGGGSKEISQMATFSDTKDIIYPYIPYEYHFDKDLSARINQPTYVELRTPKGDYPKDAVTYRIKLVYEFSNLILGDELLQVLRDNTYTLTAKRKGTVQADGSWTLVLRKPNKDSGGWKLNVGRFGTIVIGIPGSFQFILSLPKQERNEVNVFREYQTILGDNKFDATSSFYGSEEPDKVIVKYPKGFAKIDPVAERVIDLKGPIQPTASDRNEMVIDDQLIREYFKIDLDSYHKMVLRRDSLNDHWHLQVYSNWNSRILRVDTTLKNVHAIIAGPAHAWKFLLDLAGSQEMSYDLNNVIYRHLRSHYFS